MRYNKLTTALIAAAIGITGGFEGYNRVAYQDGGGVWTACWGETLNIKPGDEFTDEQCQAMFIKSLNTHNAPIERIPQKIPANVHLASLDMSYNIGVNAFSRSTMYRYLQNADYPNACMEPNRWTYVRIDGELRNCRDPQWNCRGIVTRREIVTQLCLGQMSINDALIRLGQLPLDREIIEQLNAH